MQAVLSQRRLNPPQLLYCYHIAQGLTEAEALEKAGYSIKNKRQTLAKFKRNHLITEEIARQSEAVTKSKAYDLEVLIERLDCIIKDTPTSDPELTRKVLNDIARLKGYLTPIKSTGKTLNINVLGEVKALPKLPPSPEVIDIIDEASIKGKKK